MALGYSLFLLTDNREGAFILPGGRHLEWDVQAPSKAARRSHLRMGCFCQFDSCCACVGPNMVLNVAGSSSSCDNVKLGRCPVCLGTSLPWGQRASKAMRLWDNVGVPNHQPQCGTVQHPCAPATSHIQAPAAVLSLRVMSTGQSANCSSLSLLSGNASSFISCHHSSEQSSACAQVRLFSLFLGVHCILQSRLKKSLQNKFWRWQFVHQHSTER